MTREDELLSIIESAKKELAEIRKPMSIEEASIYLIEKTGNKVLSSDGYTYVGYDGVGIMYYKTMVVKTSTATYKKIING